MARKHSKQKIEKQEGLGMNALLGVASVLAILVIITAYAVGFQAGKLRAGGLDDVTGEATGPVAAQGNDPPPVPAPTPTPEPTPPPRADVSLEGAAIKGDPDAPVTIIEFSDFECPFCARHYEQTLPQIEQEYIDTGKVKYAFMDFPLSFHPNAQKAGEAGKCALAQGNEFFWAMHDKLFENRQSLSEANYKQWAREIGLNGAQFDECLDSDAMASKVQADFNAGRQAGIRGTPGFLINGKLVSGAQPYTVFKQAIDAELA